MAGTIVADTVQNGAGTSTSMTNVVSGACVAWAKFQGGNGNTAGVILASYNTSSITVNGTGDYTVNFTNALTDINYCVVAGSDTNNSANAQHIQVFWNVTGNTAAAPTTTTCRVANLNTGAGVNTANICIAVHR